jgi:hypothetical protein
MIGFLKDFLLIAAFCVITVPCLVVGMFVISFALDLCKPLIQKVLGK